MTTADSPPNPDAGPLPAGSALDALHFGDGRFRTLGLIGKGATGLVHRVHDRVTGSTVALKTLGAKRPDDIYRLKHEFRSIADIRHPNLVELYELFADDAECFFTMEVIDGRPPANFLAHLGRPGSDEYRLAFLDLARQLGDAVNALQVAGTLHRDLKPSNVLVEEPGGRVVVLDYGFAVAMRGDRVAEWESGGVAGTFAYMPPEVLWGVAPAPSSDWYSVGVLLYELATGALPFDGAPAAVVSAKSRQPRRPVGTAAPWLPEPVASLIGALLAPAPEDRPSYRDFTTCLRSGEARRVYRSASVPIRRAATFVGRDDEMAVLLDAYTGLERGASRVVFLSGASGVGKTELMQQFLHRIGATGEPLLLTGRCCPQESVPFRAFDRIVDALSSFLNAQSPEQIASLLPRHAADLTRLFPVLLRSAAFARGDARGEQADPRELRRRGFGALRELLARIADQRRVVIWIDDLQWSDEDSAALASELLSAPDAPNLLLVASFRSQDAERVADLWSDVFRDSVVSHLSLQPLADGDAHHLAAKLGEGLAVDLDAIIGDARGSPLLLCQLIGHVRARLDRGMPHEVTRGAGLDQVLGERIDGLTDLARSVLLTACVAGRPTSRQVVLEAAGPGERARPILRSLEHDQLLRSTPLGDQVGVEVYHDRVREFVISAIPAAERRRCHHRLAATLERADAQDEEAIFSHYRQAEQPAAARPWGRRAADRAAAALAFSDAARLYGETLALTPAGAPDRTELLTRQADALVNCGRGAAAGPLYLEAAGAMSGTAGIEARRKAAEQYLVSGHIANGDAIIRDLVADLAIRVPRSTAALALASAARLAWLRVRGLRPAAPAPTANRAVEALRVDVCHSAAKGLAMVDPFRGLFFAVASLSRALANGDAGRTARALAGVGAALLPAGRPFDAFARHMLEAARDIARASADPYLHGFTAITMAQLPMMDARWHAMLELLDEGLALLREHSRGVTWELDIGAVAKLRALEELGRYRELREFADAVLREAESVSDIYGSVCALFSLGLAALAVGDIAAARAHASRARDIWTPTGFHMQHLYALRLQACADLVADEPREALGRLDAAWDAIVKSNLLRHALLRMDVQILLARAALGVARQAGREAAAGLARADRAARALEAEQRPDARAHAAQIRGTIDALSGRRSEACRVLRGAAESFQGLGMPIHATVARCRAAQIAQEPLEVTDAAATLRHLAVDAASILRWYAPGFAAVAAADA